MINKLIELGKLENIEIEVIKIDTICTEIETFDDKLDKYETLNEVNYFIKAIYNKKTITLNTTNIKNYKKIINTIKEVSSSLDNDDKNEFAKKSIKGTFSLKQEKLDYKKVLNDLLSLNDLKKKYPSLVSINPSFSTNYVSKTLQNSKVILKDYNVYNSYSFEILVKKNGLKENNSYYESNRKYDFNKIKEKVEELIIETENKLNAHSIKSGKYDIILGKKASWSILKSFSNIFLNKGIREHTSVLSNTFNKKIFSDKITIIEDPNNNERVTRRLFDKEGTKTEYKVIVKNGVFVKKLYNNAEALKDDTISTGNADGVTNIYIKNGDTQFDDLINHLNDGIYIDEIVSFHGINTKNGNISLQATGYIVKNGKISEAIKMIVLSTDLLELFGNVIEVENDLEFTGKNGASPSLLIKNISIAGSEE